VGGPAPDGLAAGDDGDRGTPPDTTELERLLRALRRRADAGLVGRRPWLNAAGAAAASVDDIDFMDPAV
jgi:hypothetical protein